MNVQEVPIARPCPARWDRMAGTDQARFCRECRQTVYDLSAMTEDQARAFAAANPTACRRYTYDGRTGAILHRQAGCGAARVRIASRRAGAVAAISVALAGPAQASVSADVDLGWLSWARETVEAYAESLAVWIGWTDPVEVLPVIGQRTSIIPEALEGLEPADRVPPPVPEHHFVTAGVPPPLPRADTRRTMGR